MRLIQDTNVFVSALRSGAGASRVFLLHLLRGNQSPIIGDKLFLEYQDLIGRPGELWAGGAWDKARRVEALDDFAAVCEYVRISRLWRPNLPDENDNHVMELAICGNAAAVVTFNVADFENALFAPPGLIVIPPAPFMNQYAK